MTNINTVTFSGGEFSPKIDTRTDTEKYASGCRRLENMIPRKYGSVEKRPGTEMIVVGNGAACYYEGPTPDPTKIQIYTMSDLMKIGVEGTHLRSGDYELMNNLDATGSGFVPLCTPGLPFIGSFDGNYFTISNISMDASNGTVSFFRSVNSATIENLTLSNMAITNAGSACALLTSNDFGATAITNVHVQGSISGSQNNQSGGLIHTTNANMSICSANVINTSSRNFFSAGGLCYFSGGDIANCYATGSIINTSGTDSLTRVGGLIGLKGGTNNSITNCYSSVIISGIEDSGIPGEIGGFIGNNSDGGTLTHTGIYWDGDLIATPPAPLNDVGTDGDVAGIAKSTTSSMQQQATYSGWDFSTIWMIDEGNDYPRLKWQENADFKQICQAV